MNESGWLHERSCAQWMIHAPRTGKMPRTKAGRRKLRLFACGCCRLIWEHLPDDRLRAAVDVAERFAAAPGQTVRGGWRADGRAGERCGAGRGEAFKADRACRRSPW